MAVRCPFGYPAVVETRPYLEDGTPFPTLLYLTCPSAVGAIARLEERGGVEAFRHRVKTDPEVQRALDALTRAYSARRRELAPAGRQTDGGSVLERGIGGPAADRATCLHAYAAALLAAVEGGLAQSGQTGGRGAFVVAGPTDHPAIGRSRDAAVWCDLLQGFGEIWCDDQRCAAFGPPAALRAAVDVGTNSVRLLVARVTAAGVHTLVRRAQVTRLGEGLAAPPGSERGRGDGFSLHPAARARTAATVDRYVDEARRAGAEVIRLVGTSACRQAVDGRDFIAELGSRHGIEAAVVSGELEAALAYAGATLEVRGPVVLVDVGGGSTELVTRVGPVGRPADIEAVSLPVGCVTGTERWFGQDPPTPARRAAARAEVAAAVAPHREVFGTAVDAGPSGGGLPDTHSAEATFMGVAGTVTTFACLALHLREYDPDLIHLQRLEWGQIVTQQERLAALDTPGRAALPCMQAGRADVIVAGGEILLGVMQALGWRALVVSERDMLDGIVMAESLAEGQ